MRPLTKSFTKPGPGIVLEGVYLVHYSKLRSLALKRILRFEIKRMATLFQEA